jgi:hypothetical protein
MAMRGIVVRPVDDRRAFPGILDFVTADFDLITGHDGDGRREVDVVDYLDWSARGLRPELFVLGMRMRAPEKCRPAGYGCHHIDHLPILLCAWITRARGNV